MSIPKIAALEVSFLLLAVFANAASRSNIMQIKILDSVTRAVSGDNNGVPLNCDQLTFDAYCRSTSTVPLVSTLLVQEGDAPPFRISCTMESRYSRCTPLPKGAIFDAKRDKHGITVYYVDDKGKERNQLYRLLQSRHGRRVRRPIRPSQGPTRRRLGRAGCKWSIPKKYVAISVQPRLVPKSPSMASTWATRHPKSAL